MADFVKVLCSIPNGVRLRMTRPFDDGTGVKQTYPVGAEHVVAGPRSPASDFGGGPVETEVPCEFWDAWVAQNESNPILKDGSLQVRKDDDEDEAGPR